MMQLSHFSVMKKLFMVTVFSITVIVPVSAKDNLVFFGGPAGGTFQIVAN